MAKKEEKGPSLSEQLKSLEDAITNGNAKNLYFFFGCEKALKNEWKEKMIEAFTSGNPDMNSCLILGDTYDASSSICEVTTVPFCAEKRVVVFESCDVFNKVELKELFLDIPCETIVIVIQEGLQNILKDDSKLDDSENKKTKWTLKDLKEVDYVDINFDAEKSQILSSKIKDWAEFEGVKIEKLTITYLTNCCGTDSAQLKNEVAKLCAFVKSQGKNEIVAADINEICTFQLEVDIFNMLNSIENRKTSEAISTYKDLIAKGNKPISIITTLFSRFELLYQTKLAMQDKDSTNKLAELFQGKNPAYANFTKNFAKRFTLSNLKKIINQINDNYIGTFTGNDDCETLIYEIIGMIK